jgi:catechol 2,3-dioxygenase-like lactoylglutathione lyase family enzyme
MPALPTIVRTINMDCPDPQAMARFYGGLLGWEPTAVEPDWVLMRAPDGGTGLSFQQTEGYEPPTWPETPGKQQKMIHLELPVRPKEGDYTEEEGRLALDEAAQVATELGGTLADHQARPDIRVMLDPSGHPLCLFLD